MAYLVPHSRAEYDHRAPGELLCLKPRGRKEMGVLQIGDRVRATYWVPGMPKYLIGEIGTVHDVHRLYVTVRFPSSTGLRKVPKRAVKFVENEPQEEVG